MTATLTARAAARVGAIRAVVLSPYTGQPVEVVAAESTGRHVRLVTRRGRDLLVDPDERLVVVPREGEPRRRRSAARRPGVRSHGRGRS